MDHGLHCCLANATRHNATAQEAWIQNLESVYLRVQPVLSGFVIGTGLAGIVGNVLTLVVFVKLGIRKTIHTSYAALAVSDLCSVIATMIYGIWTSFSTEDVLQRHRLKANADMISIVFAVTPNLAFFRTTALITAWVSIARCISVVCPIRAKGMLTRRVSVAALVACFLLGCGPLACLYPGLSLDWQFDPHSNYTNLEITFDGESLATWIASALYGFVYPVLSWITVAVCTALLVLKVRQSARFKILNSSAAPRPGTGHNQMSTKELRLTKTVLAVAGVFVLLTLPLTVQSISVLIVKGYSPQGPLRYLFQISMLVCLLLSELNSTVNIVVFTVLGFKFRSVLIKMFSFK